MLVAITGTPGCGKTTVARILSGRDYHVVSVKEIVERTGIPAEHDSETDAIEIDVEALFHAAGPFLPGNGFVEGHLAHFLPVDAMVVLRLSPGLLAQRLAPRGYPGKKVRENVEAEAIGVILTEAIEHVNDAGHQDEDLQKVYEIDITSLSPDTVADLLEDILLGRAGHDLYAPGRVDWSEDILSWY